MVYSAGSNKVKSKKERKTGGCVGVGVCVYAYSRFALNQKIRFLRFLLYKSSVACFYGWIHYKMVFDYLQ